MKNKKMKIALTILQFICFLVFLFLSYTILLIDGIETELRYIGIGVLFLLNIGLLFLRKITKKGKTTPYIIYIIVISLFILIQGVLGFFVYKTYSSLNNINKDSITYTSALVVLSDSKIKAIDALKGKEIGIVSDETSIDGYVLANQIIKKHDLNDIATIVEYDDVVNLMKDLYAEKIDAILLSKDYPSIFRTLEGYEKIDEETKILDEISKEYKKSEIAKITGDEMINYNKSASITEPFTVLIMGIDSTSETLNKNATGNGDALMLVTFNPKTLNATIMSIPRDSYVYLPSMGTENKITHAAWAGTSNMIRTIEMFTGIDIDYYVKINFQGVIKLVNLLGGITVDVPIDFCESNAYRQTSKDKEICLKEGVQKLNGEQALALARHRKSFATGDLARGSNQQLVVQGILNQAKEIKSANQALNMLDTMSKSMDTNFTTKQMLSFYDIFKTILETSANQDNLINIRQLYLSGSNQGIYDERTGLVLSDYIINESSLNQCISEMEKNLGIEKTKMKKEIDFDIEDKFELTTVGKSNLSATKIYTLLPNFEGKNISYAENWLKSYNIDIEFEEQESEKEEGTIISQSLPQYKRVDLIDGSIKFIIAKPIETPIEPDIPTSGTEEENGEENTEENGGENTDNTDNTDNESTTPPESNETPENSETPDDSENTESETNE